MHKDYSQAQCSLVFHNPWELLMATILSAQCTDERVNLITQDLFEKYIAIADYANSNLPDLGLEVRSTGFYRHKAKNIQNATKMIIRVFNSHLPDRMNLLLKLPGVAQKTANVVLGNTFGKAEGIVVDTHVGRVSQRLGLTKMKIRKKLSKT